MLSQPEIQLKALNASADDTEICMLFYRLGLLIGKFHRSYGRLPTDYEMYALWNHEELALGMPRGGYSPELKQRCKDFAQRCEQLRSSGKDEVDKQDAGDKTAT